VPNLVGVLRGEGSGPELVDAACHVLTAAAARSGIDLRLETYDDAPSSTGADCSNHLSRGVARFCEEIFARDGAILAGAAGGRFVYDMRRHFHLYYKLNPLRSYRELAGIVRIKTREAVDILIVRENLGGLYQGKTVERIVCDSSEVSHTFVQREEEVRAVLDVGAKAARARRNSLAVVGKQSGLPEIYSLWRRCALDAGRSYGVKVTLYDIDYAAYELLHEPCSFDVVVAPNCFGDILSDLGGLLAGSRGLTFGASYSANGAAVYQTNHGAAHDLAGSDRANPVAQIFSAAMMLRQTFQLEEEAQLVEEAVRAVWRAGWRTADICESGCRIARTRQFADLVSEEICAAAFRDREACSAAG
jgi:3-isopropylmalate dehydrogenase